MGLLKLYMRAILRAGYDAGDIYVAQQKPDSYFLGFLIWLPPGEGLFGT